MNPRQPLTIRSTVWLVMALTVASTALGAVGLHSYRLHRQARLGERLRTQAVAEAYADQVAPRMMRGQRTELVAFIRGLAWHQNSRLLAVLDPNGETLTARGAAQILNRYDVLSAGSPGPSWSVKGDPNDLVSEYALAAVPLRDGVSPEPLGTLVYAMVSPRGTTFGSAENWGFFIQLALIAAAGMMMGFLWMKRRVLDPLAVLSAGPESRDEQQDLPVERPDEIGAVARTLQKLKTELEDSQTRAERLEHTITARVARETQRIARELKRAQHKIWTDPLTDLGNRRLLDAKLAEIFQAQTDSGEELSIVMIDMDNFKPLNDSLGHRAGDELLQFTGELLRQCLREQDLAVRYGGDEFMLVLPSVAPEQARAIADRTIALFAQRACLLPVSDKPTMSAGIASLRRHQPLCADDLLQMADVALYHAKSTGKACSCIYAPDLLAVKADNRPSGGGLHARHTSAGFSHCRRDPPGCHCR